MKNDLPQSFVSRVRASLSSLHPSERQLAETVLNFPGDMAGYTASEIAALAGVSNATVSRFVRKIGYQSYDEARKAVRDAGKTGTALLRFGAREGDASQAVALHLAQSVQDLEATYASLTPQHVDEIVTAMHAAPHVWLAGYRAGYPLASYLAMQINQVLPSVAVIPKSGETLAETAATFSQSDVLVLVGLRRAPKSAAHVVRTALDAGVQVALLSDVAELDALPVQWRLACATTSKGPLLNHTGVIALCNLIASRTLELSGPEGRQRMGLIEDIHDRLGEL